MVLRPQRSYKHFCMGCSLTLIKCVCVCVRLVAGVFDCSLSIELIGFSLAARSLKAGCSQVPVPNPLSARLPACSTVSKMCF